MLVNMRDLLADARVGGYAVGSFSVANMELSLIHISEPTRRS